MLPIFVAFFFLEAGAKEEFITDSAELLPALL